MHWNNNSKHCNQDSQTTTILQGHVGNLSQTNNPVCLVSQTLYLTVKVG